MERDLRISGDSLKTVAPFTVGKYCILTFFLSFYSWSATRQHKIYLGNQLKDLKGQNIKHCFHCAMAEHILHASS